MNARSLPLFPRASDAPRPGVDLNDRFVFVRSSAADLSEVDAGAGDEPRIPLVEAGDRTPLPLLLEEGAAGVVVDAEAATDRFWETLRENDRAHPWSLLPCVLLATGEDVGENRSPGNDSGRGAPWDERCVRESGRPVLVLERPVSARRLRRALRAALRLRRQQYHVRDLLAQLQASNETLRAECETLRRHRATLRSRIAVQVRQLRNLALAVTTAEQEERARLARLLHDHFQHYIHGAKMWAETQRDAAEAAPPDTLDRVVDLLDEALHLTRSFSVDLSPPVLRTDGLHAAFEWLSDHMREAHDLRIDLRVSPSLRVPSQKMRILLFECTRELLFNVVKHAGTRTAVLAAAVRPNGQKDGGEDPAITVVVRDRGCGFEPAAASNPSAEAGLGLRAVDRRIRLVGGCTTIDAAPGQGTTVRLQVPISPAATASDSETAVEQLGPSAVVESEDTVG